MCVWTPVERDGVTAPLKLRPYGTIQICLLLLLLQACFKQFCTIFPPHIFNKIFNKTEWWGAGMVICLERGADLYIAQLMPLPLTVSCFSKIQIGFTFLVPTHPGSP